MCGCVCACMCVRGVGGLPQPALDHDSLSRRRSKSSRKWTCMRKKQPTVNYIPSSNRVKIVRICMYVCKYDKGNPFFSELCNLNWQYSGCYMVCIFQCFAPWKLKKRRKGKEARAVSSRLNHKLWFSDLIRRDGAGERVYCFVTRSPGSPLSPGSGCICVSMLAAGEVCPTESYMLRSLSWDIWTLCPCTALNDEHKGWTLIGPTDLCIWLPWWRLYIPIFWMCEPVHVVWRLLY